MSDTRTREELIRQLDAIRIRTQELEESKRKSDTEAYRLSQLQKRTTGELQISERRYAELVESVASAILRLDATGTIVFCNRFTLDYFGYLREELIGRPLVGTLLPKTDSAGKHLGNLVEQIAADPATYTNHVNENVCRDGSRVWVAWTNRLLYDANGEIREVLCVGNDISERVEREAELNRLNEELQIFTNAVSHDLRTPITNVSGFAQLLRDSADNLNDEQRGHIQRILRSCTFMVDLIQDYLAFARSTKSDLKHEPISLDHFARQAIDALRMNNLKRTVEFRCEKKLRAFGDRHLIRQVVDNLIGNAWKYTAMTEDVVIEFGGTETPRGLACYVRDNGAGFDPARTDELFKPFARLHDKTEFPGSGVGLATVQRIVSRHGGEVWGEGEPGRGATFYFTLPELSEAAD